jgi:hypothetical protein
VCTGEYGQFFLGKKPCSKLVTPAFEQRKFICVHSQGKLNKCHKKYFYAYGFSKQKAALA